MASPILLVCMSIFIIFMRIWCLCSCKMLTVCCNWAQRSSWLLTESRRQKPTFWQGEWKRTLTQDQGGWSDLSGMYRDTARKIFSQVFLNARKGDISCQWSHTRGRSFVQGMRFWNEKCLLLRNGQMRSLGILSVQWWVLSNGPLEKYLTVYGLALCIDFL